MSKALRSALLASAAAIGVCAAGPSYAIIVEADIQVVESPGQYEIINNTADQYVWQLDVTNPNADSSGAWTTQPNWSACGYGSCVGNAFEYTALAGSASDATSLSYDIQPGQSSSNFFFGAAPSSTATVYTVDANGNTNSYTFATRSVPEPATWALMVLGFGGMAAAAWASRRRAAQATEST